MIRVLVVDDSAVVRSVLTEELSKAADIEVIATATDPYLARDKIVALRPDVLTLDIEMPRMDGLTFLQKLMRHRPMPVVVVSSVTHRGSEGAVRALDLGAVDVVSKPGSSFTVGDICTSLMSSIRAASRARVDRWEVGRDGDEAPSVSLPQVVRTTHRVIAIGASTGGTTAIREVLSRLPGTTPGTVIVQHMPEHFTAAFAKRLDEQCAMTVREARDGEAIIPGVALIAPGNRHMVLQRSGARYQVALRDGPPVHYQRPSVDVLFHSAARQCGRNCLAVILTGMGSDGAAGMLALREAGATTIAQDEASSVVYGMPRAAVEMDAVDHSAALQDIPSRIFQCLAAEGSGRARPSGGTGGTERLSS